LERDCAGERVWDGLERLFVGAYIGYYGDHREKKGATLGKLIITSKSPCK
jgi:hypothetical protein